MSDLNVIGWIREAKRSTEMKALARLRLAQLITEGDLLAEYPHSERAAAIFPSDFGTCRTALWATKHGLEDIERDPIDDELCRLDFGSLVGAWEACLVEARLRSDPDWMAHLEFVPAGGGHIDLLLIHRHTGERVPVEFKSTYSKPTAPIKPPEKENKSHLLQVGDYATQLEAGRMVLVYIKPPADAGERMKQFVRDAAPWGPLVANERARLAPALEDEAPTPDPQTKWACYTCRYSACAKNKNKAAKSVDLLLAS